MVKATQKVRLVNPTRIVSAASRKENPLLHALGYLNPQGERKQMNQKPTKKKAAAKAKAAASPKKASKATPARKANPLFVVKMPTAPAVQTPKKKKKISNPKAIPLLGKGVDYLKLSLFALVGLVATRQVPQIALGEKNKGWIGYGSNFVTMILTAIAAGSLSRSPQAGLATGIGGGVYFVERLLRENLSPVGKVLSLSGVGDAMAASKNTLGRMVPAYFPTPVAYDKDGRVIIPSQIVEAVMAELRAQAMPTTQQLQTMPQDGATMGRYRSRFAA